MKLTVFGMGKLGSPLAALFASVGHDVFCVDNNEQVLDMIREGKPPVNEPGLRDLFAIFKHRLIPVSMKDAEHAVANSDFVFIIVPTPSQPDGSFSNAAILDALVPIASAISRGAHPAVVVTATTSPGACHSQIIPALETLSGKGCGVDFGFCYNPEFIALGSVLHDMRHPDYILIGETTKNYGDALQAFYEELHHELGHACPPIARMNIVNAEIAKLATNCFATMKISYANSLADICEAYPNADARVVCDAIGLDSRIGSKYLRPATAYGGPCFPRDGRAMLHTAQSQHVPVPLIQATDATNQRQLDKLLDIISARKCRRLAILGLSYKPATHVTEESIAVRLLNALNIFEFEWIRVHDPQATLDMPGVLMCYKPDTAIRNADLVIIATAWPQFAELSPDDFLYGTVIVDCWDMLGPDFHARTIIKPGKGRFCHPYWTNSNADELGNGNEPRP